MKFTGKNLNAVFDFIYCSSLGGITNDSLCEMRELRASEDV
jgi:hypothetical protein